MYHPCIIKSKVITLEYCHLSHLHVVNIARMADSESKTVHFQYKISSINTNVTVIGITQ